jgi:hypothetical protein
MRAFVIIATVKLGSIGHGVHPIFIGNEKLMDTTTAST